MQQPNVIFIPAPYPLDLKACRSCLATDVQLFNLHKNGLAELFGDLLKTPVNHSDGHPQYVCCYCQAQLNKCLTFRNMARKAHVFFQELRVYNLVIDTDFIRNVDKKQFIKPLARTKPLVLDFPLEVQQYTGNSRPIQNPLNTHTVNLKNELNPLDDDIQNDIKNINNDGEYENVFENFVDEKFLIENVMIKNKDDVNPKIELKTEIIQETSKPKESKVKTKKRDQNTQKVKAKPESKTKRKDPDTKNKRFLIYRYVNKTQEKKFNRYNEKFDVDYEEFSKMYDVTVKSLSKEERIQRIEERRESKEYKESRFSCDVCYKGFMSILAHKRHMKAHDPSSGSFACEVCKLRYRTQRAMALHARKHKKIFLCNICDMVNVNSFACEVCKLRYRTQRAMALHARKHKKIFLCNICDMVNVNSARAKVHAKWHKGEKFSCKICDKQLNAHSTLMHHMREVHKKVKCELCGETLSGTKQLDKHMLQSHAQNECKICKTIFQSAEALEIHREVPCDDKKNACVICGLSFTHRSDLNQHMRQEHNEEGKIFACEQCDSVFASDRALSRHFVQSHYTLKKLTGQLQFLCDGCGKGIPAERCSSCNGMFRPEALLAHSNVCDPNKCWCPMCGDGFPSEELMRQHYDESHKDQFKCDECNQTISIVPVNKRSVKRGVGRQRQRSESVTPSNGLMCEQCGKGNFKAPCLLRSHQRTHTGERPFRCKHCPKSFIQMQNLKVHMMVHTGERPFKCPRCPKAYKTYAARYTHIMTHTNQRPYACTTCNKRYTGQTALKEHINTAHRGLPPRQRNKHNKQEL